MANKKYKLANNDYWESSGVYDLTEGKTQREVNAALKGSLNAVSFISKEELSKKRFVCIGDSYAAGWTQETGTVEANGWPQKLRAKLNISNDNFIVNYLGGVGFAHAMDGVRFEHLVNTVNVSNPNTIDFVIICGGYNDASSAYADIETGILNSVNNAKTRFPNAKIFIGFVGMTYADHSIFAYLTQRQRVYESCASKYGYYYLRNIEACLYLESRMSAADKYHPTADGNDAIADGIIRCLINGYNNIHESGHITLTPLDNINIPTPSAFYEIEDNTITISFVRNNTSKTAETSSENWHALNNYAYPLFKAGIMAFMRGQFDPAKTMSLVVRRYSANETNGAYRTIVVNFSLRNVNDFVMLISDTNEAGNNYLTAGFGEVQLPPMSISYNVFGNALI